MKVTLNFWTARISRSFFSCMLLVATLLLLNSCGDDPEPVNEEEVVTTLTLTLVPQGGGNTVIMKFFDEDGENGAKAPVITVSGTLAASKTYLATVVLLNETENPAEDVTAEVAEEANDHLFCYTVTTANITVTYKDKDANNKPLGIATEWITGAASTGKVNVVLRHQPGVKTGVCPGAGESDIDVDFNVTIQ